MGFGTIAANIMMFIVIIMLTGGLVLKMNSYAQETSSTLATQKTKMLEELRSDITINSAYYDNITFPNQIYVYVKNTGKIRLGIESVDIYIDGDRISNSIRNTTVEADTVIEGNYYWDPTEIILINITETLNPGHYQVKVLADNNALDETLLTVT